MAFIRPYEKRDFEATAHICRETLPPSLRTPAARLLAPYLWTHQYTHLSPSTCFVLDDGTGTAVGYCIGCPSIPDFIAAYPSYVAEVLDASAQVLDLRPDPLAPAEPWTHADGSVNGACLAQLAYDPQRLLLAGERAAVAAARYPATLHIDLLEPWQRRGWGGQLLERTVGALADEQQKQQQRRRRQRCAVSSGNEVDDDDTRQRGGVWLGVAEDNAKVVPFYQRMGFQLLETDDDDDECDKDQGQDQDQDQEPNAQHHCSNHQQQKQHQPPQNRNHKNGEKTEAGRGAEGGKRKRKGGGGGIVLVREFLGEPAGKVGGGGTGAE